MLKGVADGEMDLPRALLFFGVEFVAVEEADGADGRHIAETASQGGAKSLFQGIVFQVTEPAAVQEQDEFNGVREGDAGFYTC